MTMPWRLDQSNASSPYTGGALDVQTWLSAHQSNASPPTDPWISPWVNSNNFATNSLTSRDKGTIEDYYLARLEDEASPIGTAWKYASDAIFDTLMGGFSGIENLLVSFVRWFLGDDFTTEEMELLPDWFKGTEEEPGLFGNIRNFVNTIPEWFAPFEPFIEELQAIFTEAFRDTIENLADFVKWFYDEGVVQLVKNVVTLLKGIATGTGENIVVPMLTALKNIFDNTPFVETILTAIIDLLKPLVTNQGAEALTTFLNVWKAIVNKLVDITNLDGFLNAFRLIINALISWGEPDSPAVTVLKDLISALVGVTDFNNWIQFFTALINKFAAFFKPGQTTMQTALTNFGGIIDIFLSFFASLNTLPATWVSVLKLIIEKIMGISVVGQDLLAWLGQWFDGLIQFVNRLFSNNGAFLTNLVDDLFEFFGTVGQVAGNWIGVLRVILEQLTALVLGANKTFDQWFKGIVDFGKKLFELTNVETFLTNMFAFLTSLGSVPANFVAAFKAFFNKFVTGFNLVNFEKWVDRFKTFIDAITGGVSELTATAFKNVMDALQYFIRQVAILFGGGQPTASQSPINSTTGFLPAFTQAIDPVLAALNAGVSVTSGVVDLFKALTGNSAIKSIDEAVAEVASWVALIPKVPSIVSSLLGNWKNASTNTNNTLADLQAWANELLNSKSALPGFNLVGFLPQELISLLPYGNIGNTSPNLISDQSFATEAKLQAGNGWSWDGTTNAPSSTGGSAKVAGDGTVKQLFSNMVEVSQGQKMALSVQSKWTKASTATPTILVSIRGYNGAAVAFTTSVASVVAKSGFSGPTSASAYTAGAGTTATLASGWVKIAGEFTIPAGVTHARMILGTANAPSGSTVWFDDSVMQKTGLIQQSLIGGQNPNTSLLDDLVTLLPKGDFNTLVDRIAKKTNATITDVTSVINSFLTGTSPLSGNNILSGNIGSAFISELVQTWNRIAFGVSGAPQPASSLDIVDGTLSDFSLTTANNSGLLLGWTTDLRVVESDVGQIKPKVITLEKATQELQAAMGVVRPATSTLQTGYEQLKTAMGEEQAATVKFRPAISELQTGLNTEAKPAITNLQSLHNTSVKPAITELQTGLNSQVKPAVTELQTLHNTKTKTAVEQLQTGVFTTAREAVNELQTLHNTKTVTAITELQNAVRDLQAKTSTPQTAATTVTATAKSFGPVTATAVTSTTQSVPTSTTTTVGTTSAAVTTTTGTSVGSTTSPTTVTVGSGGSVPNTGLTPVAPNPVSSKASFTDDFERSALGANWTVSVFGTDSSSLGIPDGHNVRYSVPILSAGSALPTLNNPSSKTIGRVNAVWSAGSFKTPYQVVSAVLTNAASGGSYSFTGQLGSLRGPAYNDLLCRVSESNLLIGLVCRFYADGKITVFYRTSGGWENNPWSLAASSLGTFTANPKPTAGSLIEFAVGDPVVSDPTKITVRVGNAAFGPIYIPVNVSALLGNRFGFGMGNGVGPIADGSIYLQPSGALNYVAGRDG